MYLFTLRQVPGLAFRHISITYVEMMFKIRFIFPVFVLSMNHAVPLYMGLLKNTCVELYDLAIIDTFIYLMPDNSREIAKYLMTIPLPISEYMFVKIVCMKA